MNGKNNKNKIFVIQEHDATHLHWDFRLEDSGVLKSWALPKEPNLNPEDKHLAIETDDHPLSYKAFEGIIPEGNYGAGSVIVWDTGIFKNLRSETLSESLKEGKLEIFLEGKKLKGAFALIKTNYGKNSWLLIKLKDEYANKIIKSRNKSVLSNKTIDSLNKEIERQKLKDGK